MCGPPVLIASAAMSALSTGLGALQARAQAGYRANIAESNAALAREAAQKEQENTRTEALAHYRRVADLKGQQRVAAAANGVSVGFGTAADVVSDTDILAREDAQRIYDRGFERSRGFEIEAANYDASANAARSEKSGALVKGLFDFGSTALSGAQQYRALKTRRSPQIGG